MIALFMRHQGFRHYSGALECQFFHSCMCPDNLYPCMSNYLAFVCRYYAFEVAMTSPSPNIITCVYTACISFHYNHLVDHNQRLNM